MPLLEREKELAVLGRAFEGLGRGEGAGVVIQGPPGVGKSRLLAEARASAEARGFEVWSARGGVLEREYPFGVLRQLVAQLPERRAAALVDMAGPAAGVVLDPVKHPQLTAPDVHFAVLNGVFWACAAIADEHPLTLCVDECQWADEGSWRFFDFAARRLDDLPIALLLAIRTGEGAAVSGAAAVAELRASPRVEVLSLAPLSVDAVGELTRDRFAGDAVEAFAAACHKWTGGNTVVGQRTAESAQRTGGAR